MRGGRRWGWRQGTVRLTRAGASQQIAEKSSVRDDYQLTALKMIMIGEEFLMRMCEGGITSLSRMQRATKKKRLSHRTIKVVRRRNQPYLALFQAETKLPRFIKRATGKPRAAVQQVITLISSFCQRESLLISEIARHSFSWNEYLRALGRSLSRSGTVAASREDRGMAFFFRLVQCPLIKMTV